MLQCDLLHAPHGIPLTPASSNKLCAWCAQLKWPLAMVVDGESVLDTKLRMANIELINTIGVSKENLTACLECHCPGVALQQILEPRST